MNTYLRWLKTLLALVMGMIFIIACANYYFDYHNIRNPLPSSITNSTISIKASNVAYPLLTKKHSLKKGGFNNLILGTSRAGVLNGDLLNSILNGRTYNASLPAARISDMLKIFRYASQYNDIRNVLIAVDLIEFRKGENTFEDSILNYYFSLIPLLDYIFEDVDNAIYLDNGTNYYFAYEQNTKFNVKASIKNHIISYVRPDGLYDRFESSDKMLEEFKRLINTCKEKGIGVKVVILPVYIDHFNAMYAMGLGHDYENLLREISSVTEFYDFNGKNAISTNTDNYYDSSHTRTNLVDKQIIDAIYGKKATAHSPGAYVTIDNIEAHISHIRQQVTPINIDALVRMTD